MKEIQKLELLKKYGENQGKLKVIGRKVIDEKVYTIYDLVGTVFCVRV